MLTLMREGIEVRERVQPLMTYLDDVFEGLLDEQLMNVVKLDGTNNLNMPNLVLVRTTNTLYCDWTRNKTKLSNQIKPNS